VDWTGKTVLVTGGTGSFGQAFTRHLLESERVAAIRVFSRDEFKQYEMRMRLTDERLRFFIGDVRDRERLLRAFDGVDIVVHAAALKQVPACEYNPFEAVKTNVLGAENVIDAAIERGVTHVMALSTDKAVNPSNLYGATKLCAEKLFVQGNAYVGGRDTRFACVRYGNVVASRGSIIPLIFRQRSEGRVTLTDERMTRFWITLGQAVTLVRNAIADMRGGEVFVPKIPSVRTVELIKAIAPDTPIETIGIRPGEKLHEVLLTQEEARHSEDRGDHFVVLPEHPWWNPERGRVVAPLPDGFVYSSDRNKEWLDRQSILDLLPRALEDAMHYEPAVVDSLHAE
jgi:UDP-N-acetylglucosamine 4,6-dehydratase/5-epimerase